MKAKDMLEKTLEKKSTLYKAPAKGDLLNRIFDTATGLYLYSYRDYDQYITVAEWPEGRKAITTSKLMVYCQKDNKWKWIKT